MFTCLDTILERDGQTDIQPPSQIPNNGVGYAYALHRAAKRRDINYACSHTKSPIHHLIITGIY